MPPVRCGRATSEARSSALCGEGPSCELASWLAGMRDGSVAGGAIGACPVAVGVSSKGGTAEAAEGGMASEEEVECTAECGA